MNSVNINNGDNLSVLNNADLTNMVENFGLNTVAPNPEQLMIHVVNQQKLRTSNGPVEQTPFRFENHQKSLKNFFQNFLDIFGSENSFIFGMLRLFLGNF